MSERILNVSHTSEDASKLEYNGRKFRSNFELHTAEVLDALGIPYEYETRKIVLVDKFRSPFQKDMVRAITYIPDFEIGPILLECKGFETPEWKIKKKLLFKYLQENEPNTIFYQIHDCRKQLIEALDPHWMYLGYAISATPKPSKKQKPEDMQETVYDSLTQALELLNLKNKAVGPILRCLMGKTEYVYGYKWKLVKLNF